MYKIDNENFGIFVAQLRRQKGLTQKDVAQKLFVSDKAVSKWERGLSLPDISLLTPLSELLGVTVTELLRGQRIEENELLDIHEVEELVTGSLSFRQKKPKMDQLSRRRRALVFIGSVLLVAAEIALMAALGFDFDKLSRDVIAPELLFLIFAGWFCLFAKEALPSYYDQAKISSFSDGVFRMNLPGVYFNNRNWPYIICAGRLCMLGISVFFPAAYLLVGLLLPLESWERYKIFLLLPALLGFLFAMIYEGKKHE